MNKKKRQKDIKKLDKFIVLWEDPDLGKSIQHPDSFLAAEKFVNLLILEDGIDESDIMVYRYDEKYRPSVVSVSLNKVEF